jgi:hypothetical protein
MIGERRILALWAIAFQSLSAQRTAQYDKTGLLVDQRLHHGN